MSMNYDPRVFAALEYHTHRKAFADGDDSPRAFLERCLETIAEREPVVRAWVAMNEEGARKQAGDSSRRWRDGRPLSQIDGMPIGIKDLLETADMPTQMGCKAYEGNFPKRDNAAVWALRQAGAVILGKTVTTELGGAEPGPTTNPFNPSHTPGGSSSGPAAAVAARVVPVAIGTQVGGSMIRPASFCGNYALKPSQGAINRGERQVTSMSSHGPHAGSLEDMWAVVIEIARRAGGDPGHIALAGPGNLPPAQKPVTLAVMKGDGWKSMDGEAVAAFEQVIAQVERHGVAVLRDDSDGDLARFERALTGLTKLNIELTAWENHWNLRGTLAMHPDGVSQRGKRTLEIAERVGAHGYHEMLRERAAIRNVFAALAHRVDAVIAPSSPGPAPLWQADKPGEPSVAIPTGNLDFNTPSSLPLAAVHGLPMGIQVMGQPGTDARMAAIAHWLRVTVDPVLY